jgi:hypothetical protein
MFGGLRGGWSNLKAKMDGGKDGVVVVGAWHHLRTLVASALAHAEHFELRLISISALGARQIEKIVDIMATQTRLPFDSLPLEARIRFDATAS